ncbi:MAG TPA: ABC transporter permease, partial [Bryobacteraceae bacterium]
MSRMNEQWQRVKHLFSRKRRGFDDDLAEEMRLHLDLRTAENPAAERDARVRFGNVSRIQEDSRAAWGWPAFESIFQDVRYGVRTLWSSPAFTITAILSLTLAIGANTAIFSLLNAVMLRTLPVKDPSQLVMIEHTQGPSFTYPMWEQVRDHAEAFDGVLAYSEMQFDLSSGGVRQFASGLMVSGDYFRTLGVPAIRGRVLTTADDKRAGAGPDGPVAVISESFWKSRYDGDPSIIGRTVTLDRVKFQIVGVTPAWFHGLSKDVRYEVAVTLGCDPLFHTDRSALDQRSWWWLSTVGRLKAGASLQATEAQFGALAPEIMRASVPNWDAKGQKEFLSRKLILKPAATGFSQLGSLYGKALLTLQAVVAIVLLIACANVANLLL